MRFSPRLFSVAAIAAGLLAPARISAATMPACAPGDPVVWVNTSTKVYHEQGDRYYGNTKHGEYECKSAADKAGDHLSKQTGGTKAGATSAPAGSKATTKATPLPGAPGAAAPSPVASSSSKHRHKGSSASPAPGASPTPTPSSKKHHASSASPTPSPA